MLNTEPRPESYREDYITANNHSYYASSGIIYPEVKPLDEADKAALYANLATGAESGWDYGTRILATPRDAADDVYFPLRSLNTANIVGVDVNSILYANEVAIAGYLRASGGDANTAAAAEFESLAANRSAAMYALMWSDEHFGYFDYNLTSGSPNLWVPAASDPDDIDAATVTEGAPEGGYQLAFHAAQFYPFWLGAAPAHLKANPLAVARAYARVAALLDARPGAGVAATNYRTGQQWDRPNVWPPLVHAVTRGLLNTPPTFGGAGAGADADPAYRSTQQLALRLAQRYLDSAFCTWRATGGATSELPRLEGVGDADGDGIMFEKYSDEEISAAGGGGEYDVVEGFGWTNGVLIWAVDTFGNALVRPDCGGNLTTLTGRGVGKESVLGGSPPRAVDLSRADAGWVKKFGRRAREAAAAAKEEEKTG